MKKTDLPVCIPLLAAFLFVETAHAGLGTISGNFGGGWAKQSAADIARVDGVVPVNNWNFFDCGRF